MSKRIKLSVRNIQDVAAGLHNFGGLLARNEPLTCFGLSRLYSQSAKPMPLREIDTKKYQNQDVYRKNTLDLKLLSLLGPMFDGQATELATKASSVKWLESHAPYGVAPGPEMLGSPAYYFYYDIPKPQCPPASPKACPPKEDKCPPLKKGPICPPKKDPCSNPCEAPGDSKKKCIFSTICPVVLDKCGGKKKPPCRPCKPSCPPCPPKKDPCACPPPKPDPCACPRPKPDPCACPPPKPDPCACPPPKPKCDPCARPKRKRKSKPCAPKPPSCCPPPAPKDPCCPSSGCCKHRGPPMPPKKRCIHTCAVDNAKGGRCGGSGKKSDGPPASGQRERIKCPSRGGGGGGGGGKKSNPCASKGRGGGRFAGGGGGKKGSRCKPKGSGGGGGKKGSPCKPRGSGGGGKRKCK